MAGLALGPLKQARGVDNDLAVGGQFDVRAVHRPRCGAFEVHAFTVVAAAVARTLEFIFAGFPVRGAAEMGAARVDDEDAIGRAIDPDAIFLLPLGIHAERVVRGITDLENGGRLEQRARKKEAQEGNEPGAEKTGDRAPHQAATAGVDLTGVRRTDGSEARGARGFGGAHSRSADVAGRVFGDSHRCLGCIRFRFIRRGLRARHAIPPETYFCEIRTRPRKLPRISSRARNRKSGLQVDLERTDRDHQRGAERSGAADLPARWTRRVGKNLKRNIARSLPFHRTPQETSRMLLKTEKDVNACLRAEILEADVELP